MQCLYEAHVRPWDSPHCEHEKTLWETELRQDFAKCVVLFKDYIMQTKVNKPQELNISSTITKTEIEQKKRKPQGRVEDRYYTNQEYKALSNEQKKELKDLRAKTLRGESSTRVL